MIAVASIPITTGIALLGVRLLLGSPAVRSSICWLPFALLVPVFLLSFLGLSYRTYPFAVINRLTVWQAVGSPETLNVILIGVCVTLPSSSPALDFPVAYSGARP